MKTEQELVNEYPEIYELWHRDEFDGPAPQISVYGFQHGEGWNGIIEALCEYLDRQKIDVTVVQQKQKFSGLRFYHDGVSSDEEKKSYMAMGAIAMAEKMSFHVCEECGDSGERRGGGWLRTLCSGCYEERQQKRRPKDLNR